MRTILKTSIVVLLAVVALAGCSSTVTLHVSAATSLIDSLGVLQTSYQQLHPDVVLRFNYGASGALQQQIEQGAPADVFIAAGNKQMDALIKGGHMLENSVQAWLTNEIVLITPMSKEGNASFADLTDERFRKIAVGEASSVPVGQYTAEIFATLGIAQTLAPKLVYAKDAREVLAWVETGNADAGIVYATDALHSARVLLNAQAPAHTHSPIIYPLGIVNTSKNVIEAKRFVQFLQSAKARQILISHGFTPLF